MSPEPVQKFLADMKAHNEAEAELGRQRRFVLCKALLAKPHLLLAPTRRKLEAELRQLRANWNFIGNL